MFLATQTFTDEEFLSKHEDLASGTSAVEWHLGTMTSHLFKDEEISLTMYTEQGNDYVEGIKRSVKRLVYDFGHYKTMFDFIFKKYETLEEIIELARRNQKRFLFEPHNPIPLFTATLKQAAYVTVKWLIRREFSSNYNVRLEEMEMELSRRSRGELVEANSLPFAESVETIIKTLRTHESQIESLKKLLTRTSVNNLSTFFNQVDAYTSEFVLNTAVSQNQLIVAKRELKHANLMFGENRGLLSQFIPPDETTPRRFLKKLTDERIKLQIMYQEIFDKFVTTDAGKLYQHKTDPKLTQEQFEFAKRHLSSVVDELISGGNFLDGGKVLALKYPVMFMKLYCGFNLEFE